MIARVEESNDQGAQNVTDAGTGRPKRQLVLASASPARRGLLTAAGVEPTVEPSHVDEDAVERAASDQDLSIPQLAQLLAEVKRDDVAARLARAGSDSLVVGCDSILAWQGLALGKPGSAQAALDRLAKMQGTSGVLHTGHAVTDLATGRCVGRSCSTRVDFAPMSTAEIEAYVRTGEPLNVAGSFTLDGLSSPFIAGIEGDPSNVIGLSLPLLRELLHELGIDWLSVVSYS